jgi:hypothetical protein
VDDLKVLKIEKRTGVTKGIISRVKMTRLGGGETSEYIALPFPNFGSTIFASKGDSGCGFGVNMDD